MTVPLSLDPASGHPQVDAYLRKDYESVRGMSSRFAAAISAWLIGFQSRNGISGHFAEIGTFEGRFFIALALALQPGEKALGIDTFDWPSEKVFDNFLENCARHGVKQEAMIAWKASSGVMTVADMRMKLGEGPVRFFHIDGDHSHEPLLKDLALATALMHPQGLICLDDMLHPGYPFLVVTVEHYLRAHPQMRLMCIIDREDIVGAAKFIICHKDMTGLYEQALMSHFNRQHYVLGGDALGHHCVVLTPHPRIAVVD